VLFDTGLTAHFDETGPLIMGFVWLAGLLILAGLILSGGHPVRARNKVSSPMTFGDYVGPKGPRPESALAGNVNASVRYQTNRNDHVRQD
jgi:hypothetical protein